MTRVSLSIQTLALAEKYLAPCRATPRLLATREAAVESESIVIFVVAVMLDLFVRSCLLLSSRREIHSEAFASRLELFYPPSKVMEKRARASNDEQKGVAFKIFPPRSLSICMTRRLWLRKQLQNFLSLGKTKNESHSPVPLGTLDDCAE